MNKLKTNDNRGELRRDLGFIESAAIVIGMVIGSGIFFKPGVVFKSAGAPGLGVLAWFAGGIITLAAGLTVCEIAAAIPKTGGLYTYLDELYGSFWAFLLGWVQTVIYYPGAIAAQSIVFATQATLFLNLSPLGQKLLAIGIMCFLTLMNIIATKYGGYIQSAATIGKLLPIVIIVAAGMIWGSSGNFAPLLPSSGNVATGFGAAILGTLWAYDGWISVGNVAGEIKDPARNLPKSIISGIALVVLVYVLINIAMLNVMPMNMLTASEKPASDVAVKLFGKAGGTIISIGILVSIFGALNGYILTGGRIPLAMAERRLMPFSSLFKTVHPKYDTPVNSLLLEGILAVLYILSGTFNTLTDLIVFVLWIFFIMALYGIFKLRKRYPSDKRPFKVPLYPLTPLIGILGGAYIVVSTFVTQTANSLYGIVVTIIGIPLYFLLNRAKLE